MKSRLNELKNIKYLSRYIGGETGEVKKRGQEYIKIVLAVPHIYEDAMKSIPFKQLYYTVNSRKDSYLTRLFAPDKEYIRYLKDNNLVYNTIENSFEVINADVIIALFTSELEYTTFLKMMEICKIHFANKDKTPYMIAACENTNPKPIQDFFDDIVLGDITQNINMILNKFNKNKEVFHESLKEVKGIYDGVNLNPIYSDDMDMEIWPKSEIIPNIGIDDNIIIPLTRGCNRNCKGCKLNNSSKVEKSVSEVICEVNTSIKATGCRQIQLESNCYADYTGFPEVIYKIKNITEPSVKNVYLKDVKISKDNLWVLKYLDLKEMPRLSVLSPIEQRRNNLGVYLKDFEYVEVARQIFKHGFTKITLEYFLGTPKETYEDLNKIYDIAESIVTAYFEEYSKLPDKYIVRIEVKKYMDYTSKPHNNTELLKVKKKYITDRKKPENYIIIEFEDFEKAEIKNKLELGDRRMSAVLVKSVKAGAYMDYLDSHFNYESWQVAERMAR